MEAQNAAQEHTSEARGGLASEGLALILGSAEAGTSAVVGSTPTDPVEFRKCTQDLKALSAAKEHTHEERGGGRDSGVRRPGAGRGQLPARSVVGSGFPFFSFFSKELAQSVVLLKLWEVEDYTDLGTP